MSEPADRILYGVFDALSTLEEAAPGTDVTGVALRAAGRFAGLIADLVDKFGAETAEELIERLLAQPPERADLQAMDAALARWRARQTKEE